MRVILGCDPLLSPLTGIGNYTYQVALTLLREKRIEELKLFAHGKFYSNDLLKKVGENTARRGSIDVLGKVRQELAKSELAVNIYNKIEPKLTSRKLRAYSDYIFHSPNFILPKFDGFKVVTVHDLSTFKYPEFHPKSRVDFVNEGTLSAIANADHIVADSNFIKRELIEEFGLDSQRITAIHLAADADFKPRNEAQCEVILSKYNLKYKQYCLCVSTVEPRKNIIRMLSAYKFLRQKKQISVPIVLIGGRGWNNEREYEAIDDLARRGWLKYLGYVPSNELKVFYSAARCLFFTSLYEGFGLPVIEAHQSGIPVLTSKNTAMEEVAAKGSVLVEAGSISSIAEGMKNILDLDCDVVPVAKESQFTWQDSVSKLCDIFARLKPA